MNYKVIKNIWETKSYLNLLLFLVAIFISITITLQLYVLPSLKNIAVTNMLNEAKNVSYYMSNLIDYNNEKTQDIDKKLSTVLEDFNIDKVHYFNNNGKIIYSTVKEKIGTSNTHTYFKNVVSYGNLFYSIKQKGSINLHSEVLTKSIIEIYVPIMNNDSFIGAFELYYDISAVVKEFDDYSNLLFKINILIVGVLFVLFFILLYLISAKSLREKELISKDYLTDLYNRRYFYDIAEEYLLLCKRKHTSVSLCMIDIDDFKLINDTHGHNIGDEVLKLFALETKSVIRESDILSRFGGEEFLLLLPDTNIEDAEVLSNKICKHLENLDTNVIFTVSIGISQYENSQTIDDLIIESDKCLYTAKKEGKNRVVKSI
jgi:diguanylate cyclase (GGDEF)-like protein